MWVTGPHVLQYSARYGLFTVNWGNVSNLAHPQRFYASFYLIFPDLVSPETVFIYNKINFVE